MAELRQCDVTYCEGNDPHGGDFDHGDLERLVPLLERGADPLVAVHADHAHVHNGRGAEHDVTHLPHVTQHQAEGPVACNAHSASSGDTMTSAVGLAPANIVAKSRNCVMLTVSPRACLQRWLRRGVTQINIMKDWRVSPSKCGLVNISCLIFCSAFDSSPAAMAAFFCRLSSVTRDVPVVDTFRFILFFHSYVMATWAWYYTVYWMFRL